ncbi:MAG TPA: transcriptional repressor [Candidatus Scybalocola faecigallinarum]|uniref:Transcriptional repressor n=1 Tax=Candidatus Scybalocola faecigallinarum TaxID=2840941 RepID=A0A9D1F2R1_9FIRM|nr:transcriptional repressor [Candidatus Scybalocola faecigallinarum]
MKTVKYSRQREAIKKYLMSSTEHPTAEMVYEAIREVCPNISLGTVYRNLTFLVEHGEIIRLSCGEGSDRFDGNTSRHYHFICKKCGCVKDLTMLPIDHIDAIAGEHFDGVIDGHYAYFYGTCAQCLAGQHSAAV